MARSTLNFFTRLFSSKKKKILEKRGVYENGNNIGIGEDGESEEVYQDSTKGENPFLKTSVTASPEKSNTGATILSSSSRTQYGSSRQSQNFVENIDTVVSVIKIAERENTNQFISPSNDEAGRDLIKEQGDNISEELSKDDELEYDSMVLLSKLEQLMIKISDSAVQKSVPLVLDALVEMANHVVEFAEKLPISEQKKTSLQRLMHRDEQNYKTLNLTHINNERLVIETSVIMSSDNAKELFVSLSNDLLRLINVYLSGNVKAFKSEHISEQWKTLYTGFFVNLTKSVRNSQADHQR